MSGNADRVRCSPLHSRHEVWGARFVEVNRWQVPLVYTGADGEYRAVRESVGVFDQSHVGKLILQGPRCAEVLNRCLTNDVNHLDGPGKTQYTMACDDSGGVMADLALYRFGRHGFMMFPGPSGWLALARKLHHEHGDEIEIGVNHDSHAVLVVTGPDAGETLRRLGLPSDQEYLTFEIAGDDAGQCFVRKTGSRLLDGYEITAPNDVIVSIWDRLIDAGVTPYGMETAELLRIESGTPRHGQDFDHDVSAVEARLSWAVGWNKPAFWGRQALQEQRTAGPARRLLGLRVNEAAAFERGAAVFDRDTRIGQVTSIARPPGQAGAIALALLDASAAPGATVDVECSTARVPVHVVTPPFT